MSRFGSFVIRPFALLLTGLTMLLGAQAAAAQEKVLKDLEGAYTVTVFERDGKAVPVEVKSGVTAVSIAEGKLTIATAGKRLVAMLKVDASKKPAEIDLFPQGPEFEKGRRFLGVFQVDKGELTIVYVEEGARPKDLKGEGKGTTKLVLTRK